MIADGGIRGSRDVVLALAAGASTVMIGKLFALTNESAAPKRQSNSLTWKRNTGDRPVKIFKPISMEALKEKTVAEGIDFWAPVQGTARELIEKILGGVRSGMTYGGARNIKELQRKAEFVEVTQSYMRESLPRQ